MCMYLEVENKQTSRGKVQSVRNNSKILPDLWAGCEPLLQMTESRS